MIWIGANERWFCFGNGANPGSIALHDWNGSAISVGIQNGDTVTFALPGCRVGTLAAVFSNATPAPMAAHAPLLLTRGVSQVDVELGVNGRQGAGFALLLQCDYGDANGYASAAHAYEEQSDGSADLEPVPGQPTLGSVGPDSELAQQDSATAEGDDGDS